MSKTEAPLKIEFLGPDSLIPSASNPKLHPPEQVAQIAASIREFGFNDPIGVDADLTVIEGHGRLLAAQKLGLKTVPVIRLGHLSTAQKKAYLLAHNKLTLNTGWDLDLLRLEFEALQELDFNTLELTGFQQAEINILFEPPTLPDTEKELDSNLGDNSTREAVTCPACGEHFSV
jgi:ParB family transcriptional regulator, chromosome partitioning protein